MVFQSQLRGNPYHANGWLEFNNKTSHGALFLCPGSGAGARYIRGKERGRLDYEAEITGLKGEVAGLEADVRNLNGWQKTQNGALLRVDAKVDQLKMWIMGVLATVIASIFIGLVK